MNSISDIPRDWAYRALEIAERQGSLPNSPASMTDDQVNLCTASCVAFAGLELSSAFETNTFYDRLLDKGDKQTVIDAFCALGLTAAICKETMQINDETPVGRRLEVFRKLLNI